jgi:glutathione S-transferase
MKIYDFAASPNARKVRGVVYELGITPELVTVNILKGETRTPEFLAKNPNGRMPVLEDGDFVLWESNAIITYLAALHPEKGLLPTDPRGRADVDRWLFWQSEHLTPAFVKVLFERVVKGLSGAGAPDEAVVQAGLAEVKTVAEVLDGCLKGREYVAGKLSVADFAIAAFCSTREMAGIDLSAHPNLMGWITRIEARDSWRRVMADVQALMSAPRG